MLINMKHAHNNFGGVFSGLAMSGCYVKYHWGMLRRPVSSSCIQQSSKVLCVITGNA